MNRRVLAAGLALIVTLWSALASAQRIVLLRPKTADAALLQAFGRLKGELRVHDFEVIVVDADQDAPSPRDLADAAERVRAVATVSFLRSQGLASADVWISDRVTGKTSMRTIATSQRAEASAVLAVRAVDLLRASLREFGPGEPPPPDVVGANPDRAPEHVRVWATEPSLRRWWSLDAGVVVESTLSRLGSEYGPALALGCDPTERIALRLGFQGPLSGAHASHDDGSVTLRTQQLFAELGLRILSRAAWSLEASAALGAHHLDIRGAASPPYVGRADAAWTALAAVGLHLELRLTRGAALVLGERAVVLAPRPVVHFTDDAIAYGRPMLETASSLRVWF